MASEASRVNALIEPLRAAPAATALVFDFDGTLSAVVDQPADATPVAGAADALAALAERYSVVAVVSGRPVAFLADHLPPTVHLSGLYGLETFANGVRTEHPDAARWRPAVAAAAADLRSTTEPGGALDGALVEVKGLSITVHVRTRPELANAVERETAAIAERHGLAPRAAKMSVELHPPIPADKGTALRGLLAGRRHALFVGDDLGDLPAFAALDAATRSGQIEVGVAVAVGGPELPAEVREAAAAVIDGPSEVVALLEALRPA